MIRSTIDAEAEVTPPKILPPHYFVVALLAMIVIGFTTAGSLLPAPWFLLGILPIGLGIGLAVWGSRLFAEAGTNIIPFTESTALVTSGAFAFTRNPMYSGMILTLAGTALLLNNPLCWLVLIPFVLILQFGFVRHEEKLMAQTFGQAYLDYRAKVRRWL